MATTTNLGLKKPAYTDAADVADINDNMDIIDQFAGSANEAIASLQGRESRTIQWLNASSNANDCTDPTKVYAFGNISFTNMPPIIYARMYYFDGANPMQIAVTTGGASLCIRVYDGGWGSWCRYATEGEFLTYHGNVTFNSQGVGTVAISGALYGKPVLVTLDMDSITSVLVAGSVTSTNTVTVSAYNTETKAAWAGTRAVNIFVKV